MRRVIAIVALLLCNFVVTRGNLLDHHGGKGCFAETEYQVAVTFPWNRLPSVLPRYHLTIFRVAFIVHNERYKVWREGRKASKGLAKFAETGNTELLRQEMGYDGYLVEGVMENGTTTTNLPFVANVTTTYNRRFLAVIARVERTPDWFVASQSEDMCNSDIYFSKKKEWKLGEYNDVFLMDGGTFITPIQRNARARTVKPIQFTKTDGYNLAKQGPAAIGVFNARRKACPVFGSQGAYPVGAEWIDGPCTKCKCLDTNKDECVRQTCPPPTCEYFVFKPEICCPVCQDRTEYLKIVEKARNPDPPVIVKKPRNATVPFGGSFTLDCTSWGDPKPQIQLLKNDPDEFVHVHLTPDPTNDPGLKSASLKIDYMTEGDAGRYTCFANSRGGLKEAHAYITLKHGRDNPKVLK